MQIQTLNANLGGASTTSPTLTNALVNESVEAPLPKPVFEAVLSQLANPSSEFSQNLNSPDQTSGVIGKVYAPETGNEVEQSINSFPIDYLPLQTLANKDLSPASTNLTKAFMFSLSPTANSPQNGSQQPIPLASTTPFATPAEPDANPLIGPVIDSGVRFGKSLNEDLRNPPPVVHLNHQPTTQTKTALDSTTDFNSIATNQRITPAKSIDKISVRPIDISQTSIEQAPAHQPHHSITGVVRPNPNHASLGRSTPAALINPAENLRLPVNVSPIENAQTASPHFENEAESLSSLESSFSRPLPSNESYRPATESVPITSTNSGSPDTINPSVNATQNTSSTREIGTDHKQSFTVSTSSPSIGSSQNALNNTLSVDTEPAGQPAASRQNPEAAPIASLTSPTSQTRATDASTDLHDPTIPPLDGLSISENAAPIAEVASAVSNRFRPTAASRFNAVNSATLGQATNVDAGTFTTAEQGEQSTLPLQTGASPLTFADNEAIFANADSTELADPRTPSPVATSIDSLTDSLNVTDVQITAENRVASELNGSSLSQFNLPTSEFGSESLVSAMNAAPEHGSDRFQPLDVGSNLEIKPNSETVIRDFRMPQVAEKSISEVVSEIVSQRNLEQQNGKEVTRIRIEIDPPELGEISIEISRNPHQTVATVVVANEYAQQQLGGNIQQLQTSLESLGVEFKQVEVQQQNPEQNSFDLAQRESNSQQGNRERSDGKTTNHARHPENDLTNGLEEKTTKPIQFDQCMSSTYSFKRIKSLLIGENHVIGRK